VAGKLAVPLFLVAGGLAYLAENYNMPQLTPAAIGLLGFFALVLGIETMVQGKIQLFDRLYSKREHYAGLTARLLGLLIFLFGIGILLYILWDWLQPGIPEKLLSGLVFTNQGRGILLITFGFFTAAFGLIRLIAGSAHSKEDRRFLADLGYRFTGFFGLLIGTILLMTGIWVIFFIGSR
jgi:hypothetical protein